VEPDQRGRSQGDVDVPREVAVDLDPEEEGSRDDVRGAQAHGVGEDRVHEGGAVVRDDELLEKAPEHEGRPGPEGRAVQGDAIPELRQELAPPHDRAGEQVGEVRDEEGEAGEAPLRSERAPVDVHDVADRREGEERDPDGQEEFEGGQVQVVGQGQGELAEDLDAEVVVLVERQREEEGRERQREDGLSPSGVRHAGEGVAGPERDEGDEEEQEDERAAGRVVEEVAAREQDGLLVPGLPEAVDEDQDDDEEDEELEAVELHRRPLPTPAPPPFRRPVPRRPSCPRRSCARPRR